MKTFDEAVAIIAKDQNLFQQNLKEERGPLDNKEVHRVTVQVALELIQAIAKAKDIHEALGNCCAHLHVMFSFGQLVGIEMEKKDFTL